MNTFTIKSSATVTSLALGLAGIALLSRVTESLEEAVMGGGIVLASLFFTALLGTFLQGCSSQRLLVGAAVLFSSAFTIWYAWLFHWNLDAQNSIALLFTSIYSLPLMLPLWVLAYVRRQRLG